MMKKLNMKLTFIVAALVTLAIGACSAKIEPQAIAKYLAKELSIQLKEVDEPVLVKAHVGEGDSQTAYANTVLRFRAPPGASGRGLIVGTTLVDGQEYEIDAEVQLRKDKENWVPVGVQWQRIRPVSSK